MPRWIFPSLLGFFPISERWTSKCLKQQVRTRFFPVRRVAGECITPYNVASYERQRPITRKIIITFIALTVGRLHFITDEQYQGPFPNFVNGYLSDILLSMMLFMLMGLFQNRIIRSMFFRASAIVGFGCFVKASQCLGILVATAALAEFLFSPIWGSLSDRVGSKPILMIGMFGYTLAMFAFGIVTVM